MKLRGLSRTALVLAAVLGSAPSAAAQTDGMLAVGATYSSQQSADNDVRGNGGRLGLLWRLGRGGEGWGLKYGTNWYSADISEQLAGSEQAFGRIRVRPIMAGYGYSQFVDAPLVRRMKISANLMGGYSFNSFKLQPAVSDLYRQRFNMESVETDASNALVLKPEVSVWLDLTRKVGINVDAGYMIARPTVTVQTPSGAERRRVQADMFMFKVGAVYSVF